MVNGRSAKGEAVTYTYNENEGVDVELLTDNFVDAIKQILSNKRKSEQVISDRSDNDSEF